eukprot:GHVO01062251.1.p1 GENE.GHVO01062251.1~~GHVO01062251.1.p1  ORF type:complete len:118 (-),score=2.87 GHVO01062251.1:656-1009(-)
MSTSPIVKVSPHQRPSSFDMAITRKAVPHAFQQQPLDHSVHSIRLIEIQPDLSADSLLQSTMRHATTDAEYTCLSYRWGGQPATWRILVNGHSFMVRQNLFDFLSMMREKAKMFHTG